jgi:HEAT repeat protein
MAPKLAIKALRVRELVLGLALAGLLAYAYIPRPGLGSADAVGHQLRVLQSGSPLDRSQAVAELARMADKGDTRIVPALLQAVEDQDARVRYAAVGALHVLKPDDPKVEQATAALIHVLADSDAHVRSMAAGVLSTFKPPPKAAIPGLIAMARLETPSTAAEASATAQPASLNPMENSVNRSEARRARASAVAALGAIGPNDPEVEQVLIGLDADPLVEVRAAVAQTLGEIGSESAAAFATVGKLTSDGDEFVQAQAITALGSFIKNHKAACPYLYRAYLSKQKPLVDGAIYSLQKITKSAAFDAGAARQSKEAPLRFAATFALSPNSEEGLPLLAKALRDEDPGVRQVAATRLGTASSKRAAAARQALEAGADDKDPNVRTWILRSMKLLAPKPEKSAE